MDMKGNKQKPRRVYSSARCVVAAAVPNFFWERAKSVVIPINDKAASASRMMTAADPCTHQVRLEAKSNTELQKGVLCYALVGSPAEA
jgi:hypothetical protein